MKLTDYIKVASFVCDQTHGQCGEGCSSQGLLKVARHIEKEGFMYLKEAFVLSSPGKVYSALHARQKLLQMPLVAVAIGNHQKGTRRLVLVQKQQFVNYKIFQSLLTKLTEDLKSECFSKDQMKKLLCLAESEVERERLRFAVVKSSGMTNEKARAVYDFRDMDKRCHQILDAADKAQAIKECMLKLVHLKDKGLLRSFGIEDSVSEESETESETDTEEEDHKEEKDQSWCRTLGGTQHNYEH